MIKKILVIIILAGLLFTPFFAYAQLGGNLEEVEALNKEIAARKDKIKQLEDTINKYKQNIDQERTAAVSLKNQIGILDNHGAQLEADLELTQEKIKQTELEIDALELAIKDKVAVINKQKKIVAKIIQNLHVNDQQNLLEIMLTNESFADFYNQAKYLEGVYIDLGRSVRQLRLAKEDLDSKKLAVDSRRKTYVNLQKQLSEKQQDLNEQLGVKQRLLGSTQASELRYQTLLNSLKQQYKTIEGEVRTYEEQVRKKLTEQEKLNNTPVGDTILSWPVSGRYITAYFHDPDYPYRRVFEHSGLDIRASQGTAVKAAGSGYVARARKCSLASCYSYILLVHTGELSSLYGHLSAITVSEDEFVNRGDIIGYSGGTPGTVGAGPFVTGPHLHFETRLNGIPVDPLNYLVQ